MPALTINLTNEEHDLLLKKANGHDLDLIVRMSLDAHFSQCRYTEKPLPPLDLSGSRKALAALQAGRIDPNKPLPPDRWEMRVDGLPRYPTDEDFDKAMSGYQWQLDRYNYEKQRIEKAKERNGVWNQFGGKSWEM